MNIRQSLRKIAMTAVLCSGLIAPLLVQPASAADVNNFTIQNYDVTMDLGRDSENRSTLRTREVITAYFPPNQNYGLSKVFVKDYNNHPTDLKLESVKDEAGHDLEYHWSGSNLKIGNKDTYVKGAKTYVITYTQRDVTRHYGDTGKDEFYWNVIGTFWQVPIAAGRLTLNVDPSIAGQIQTEAHCYYGASRSKNKCSVSRSGNTLTANVTNLQKTEGMTVAIGFVPGTFAQYQSPLWRRLLGWGGVVLAICAILECVYLCVRAYLWRRGSDEARQAAAIRRGAVVAEFIPPKDRSVMESAAILHISDGCVLAAQLIDWACAII